MKTKGYCFVVLLIWIQTSAQQFHPYITISPAGDPPYHGQTSPIICMKCDRKGNTFIIQEGWFGGLEQNSIINGQLFHTKDIFRLAKFDSSGNMKWTVVSRCPIQSVALDAEGNPVFEICNEDYLYVPRIELTLPAGDVKYDSTSAMLIKLNADGSLMWTYKLPVDYYKPKSEVRTDTSGNCYWCVSTTFTTYDLDLYCIDPLGKQKWKSRISGRYPTAFETSPGGDCYYCVQLPSGAPSNNHKVGKTVQPMMALFKTDGRGRESLIRSFEIEFPRNVESSARYDYENFVNYISFTPQGNPVFAFAGMFRSQLDWVFIGGRKYEPKEGDFGFLLYDQHGEISWAYFAATRTTGVYTTSYDRIGQLLRTRMTATYYQQDHWLFCIPDSTGWEHFGGYTTLNEKNDMRVFALDTRGERVTWSIKAPLSYRYGPVNNQLLGYDDSTLLLAGLSTEPLNNFFRPYNVVYKFNIQSSPPKVHIYAIAEPSSVSTDGPFLNITVTDEQPVSIPLELIIRDANGTTVVDSSFATTEKGEQHFLFDMKTWKQGSYSVHVYDQRNNDLVAILVQKK